MTIEHQKSQNILVCDGCGDDYEPYDRDEFLTMLAAAKGDGWTIYQADNGDWTHKCGSCCGATGNRLENARRLLGVPGRKGGTR